MKIIETAIRSTPGDGLRLWVQLDSGHSLSLNVGIIEGLERQTKDVLSRVEISDDRTSISWPELSFALTNLEMVKIAVGPERFENMLRSTVASDYGRRGGSVRSDAKAAAARKNGRKGGRPRTKAGSRRKRTTKTE